ncbi:SusC/RagA family TonB-linked outer membrane protein [Pontibacter anaerobius]|uniref:TonB-dependent receptor n=1 Tax=Pontibacter anaerobius TaxID=2993940 RepID=A0ABT3R9G7_9BACT|nr:TonB-dependent receptor [Pontibacter anaerobius]MCX2738416.1 TonB-dependent receptor [Pontibacter anaerobius]
MKKLLLLSFILVVTLLQQAIAQGKTVSGTVTDAESGQGLPGVTVLVKGTQVGTATGVNGNYTINVPEGSNTLTFSFIGYNTLERQVGNAATVNVALSVNNKQLQEVIVTGYGTTNTIANTGAVAQIKAAEIAEVPVASIDKALQGRVPGLQSVGASGQPGSAQQVRIRGIGSMTASSEPLYVVDGVPINSGDLSRNTTTANALAGINPNDIESITVLKDASAASIYGSRAANGVIVVTTKQGKAGKTKFNASAETGFSKRAYFNENTRPLNSEETIELASEAYLNNSLYRDFYQLTQDNIRDFILTRYGIDETVDTDWYDEVSQQGKYSQYNLSASGGNEKTQFHVSGGYFDQEGTIKTSAFERITTNLSVNHRATDKLTFGTNMMIASAKQSGPGNSGLFRNPILSSLFLTPYTSPYTEEGDLNLFTGLYNPLAIFEYDKDQNHTLKGIGSINAAYNITPNLKITSKFGVDYNNLEEDTYRNPFYGDARNTGGSATRFYTRYFNWVWTNLLDYTWDVNKDNKYVATLKGGYEAQKSSYYSSNVTSNNLPLNTNFIVPSVGAVPITASGTQADYTFASLLAIGDFTYDGKYVLSGSFRRDGSSRFGSENRYGDFWSVGASWNVDQEEFIQDLGWIDQFKLRASYGVNGNAGIGNYEWRYVYDYGIDYNGQVGAAPTSLGNPGLTWEKNKPFDLGVDLAFFQNRLTVTADYYTRETTDLLLREPLSRTTGYSTYIDNVGAMRNSGVELAVSGTPVQVGDFRWDLSFSITKNKNEIVNLIEDEQIVSPFIRKVGEDYQTYYLPVWAGVDPENGNPLWYSNEEQTETTSTWSQAKYVVTDKSATPKTFGSAGTTFSFKGITLDALFYYNFGNHIYDPYYRYLNSGGAYIGSYGQRATELDRWQQPGDITDVPRNTYGGTNAYQPSTRILNSGDFIRLRDVTLSYTLPSTWTEKVKLNNVRVYARGTNMYTWVKDDKLAYDPEAGGVGGLTNFDIEIPKTVTFGVSLGL